MCGMVTNIIEKWVDVDAAFAKFYSELELFVLPFNFRKYTNSVLTTIVSTVETLTFRLQSLLYVEHDFVHQACIPQGLPYPQFTIT